jgi:hypothetical protein
MRPGTLRLSLIGMLLLAAIVSVVANTSGSPFLRWLSFALFLCAVAVWARWRRAVLAERRGRVFDREAKTTEDRTRPDR